MNTIQNPQIVRCPIRQPCRPKTHHLPNPTRRRLDRRFLAAWVPASPAGAPDGQADWAPPAEPSALPPAAADTLLESNSSEDPAAADPSPSSSSSSSNGTDAPSTTSALLCENPADGAPLLPPAPWGLPTTITVLACWLIGFYVAAYDLVPFALRSLGVGSREAATLPAVQALRHLLLDTMQLAMTLGILARALAPYAPLSKGFFAFRLRPAVLWIQAVILGGFTFPVIDWVHKQMVGLLAGGTAGASAASASFVDGAAFDVKATWFLVLVVCAPLWEEIMFRGFLLPSLTRYLPPALAVAASSLLFATVHFTREGFLPLLLLGGVFGGAYLKTANLLPAILLHSMWNCCLLARVNFFA